ISNSSEIAGNSAPGGAGAGLLNHGDSATLNKTTVTDNTAPNDGTDDGFCGGIANVNFGLPSTPVVALTLNHSVVTASSASGRGGGTCNADDGGRPAVPSNPPAPSGQGRDRWDPLGTIAGCIG